MSNIYTIKADSQWHLICNTLEFKAIDNDLTSTLFTESFTNIIMELTKIHSTVELQNYTKHKMIQKISNIVDCSVVSDEIPCKKAMHLLSLIIHKHLSKGGDG